MTEKLTFEKIKEAVSKLKEGEELWLADRDGKKRQFIAFYKDKIVISDKYQETVIDRTKEYIQIKGWQIIRPEKKKVKLYQAVFKYESSYHIPEIVFKSEQEAKDFSGDFVKLIEPAICEIVEE